MNQTKFSVLYQYMLKSLLHPNKEKTRNVQWISLISIQCIKNNLISSRTVINRGYVIWFSIYCLMMNMCNWLTLWFKRERERSTVFSWGKKERWLSSVSRNSHKQLSLVTHLPLNKRSDINHSDEKKKMGLTSEYEMYLFHTQLLNDELTWVHF